ncbi:MAG: Wzz/FepE/Etk N-terminal domain-containing protein [Desulfobacterales bacterium]|nr:Wzz/FepE/Etk N-terminal domain-containing protein [Desulfobacterales bacterium]
MNNIPESHQNRMPNNCFLHTSHCDDEIDLRDVFFTLWQKKKIIASGVFLFVAIASVVVISMPNVYRIKTLVSPGVISRSPKDGVRFTKSLAQYKGEIDAGVYTTRLEEHLSSKFEDIMFSPKSVKVSIPKNSNALCITYDTKNIEFGKEILNYLVFLMKKEDDSIHQQFVKGLELQIELDVNALSGLEGEIESYDNYLKQIDLEKLAILRLVRKTREMSGQNSAEGIKSIAGAEISKENLYKALLHNNILIQKRQLLVNFNDKLNEINIQIGQFKNQKQSVSERYYNLLKEVGNNKRALKAITPFKEIIIVVTEEGIVGPKRAFIVMMSFVLGVFSMSFGALIHGWAVRQD